MPVILKKLLITNVTVTMVTGILSFTRISHSFSQSYVKRLKYAMSLNVMKHVTATTSDPAG